MTVVGTALLLLVGALFIIASYRLEDSFALAVFGITMFFAGLLGVASILDRLTRGDNQGGDE